MLPHGAMFCDICQGQLVLPRVDDSVLAWGDHLLDLVQGFVLAAEWVGGHRLMQGTIITTTGMGVTALRYLIIPLSCRNELVCGFCCRIRRRVHCGIKDC